MKQRAGNRPTSIAGRSPSLSLAHGPSGFRRRKRGNSLRAIAADLASRGYVNANGKEFEADGG
jgi:hypothetical protein